MSQSRQKQETSFQKTINFISKQKWALFLLLLIMTGGVAALLLKRQPEAKVEFKPRLEPTPTRALQTTHAQLALVPTAAQNASYPVCALSEAPLTFNELIFNRIVIANDYAKELSSQEIYDLTSQVFQVLMENAKYPNTRKKLERVFKSMDFKMIIDKESPHAGAAGVYDEKTNTITIYKSELNQGSELGGTLNHEIHHADCHLARGNTGSNDPFTNPQEREQLKMLIDQCNEATTTKIYQLMMKVNSGEATKYEKRTYARYENVLSDYKPKTIGIALNPSKTNCSHGSRFDFK